MFPFAFWRDLQATFKATEERLQVFDLGGVLGHLPGPWGRSLRLVRRGGGEGGMAGANTNPNASMFRHFIAEPNTANSNPLAVISLNGGA